MSKTRTFSRLLTSLFAASALLASVAPVIAQEGSPDAASPSASPGTSASPAASAAEAAAAEAQPTGTWVATAYDTLGIGLTEPLPGSTLTVAMLPEGRLEGETGCGTYVGGYTVDGEGIRLGVISKGPDPCGERRTDEAFAFSQALAVVRTWAPSPSGIELRDEAGLVRVVLERPGGGGLAGDWMVQGYARSSGNLEGVLDATEVTISFDEHGQVRGSTGCRLFEGQYSVEADRLVIAPIQMVGLPCVGDERRQDRRLRNLLDGAVLWRRSGETLTLSDGSGSSLIQSVLQVEPTPSTGPVEPLPSGTPGASARPVAWQPSAEADRGADSA